LKNNVQFVKIIRYILFEKLIKYTFPTILEYIIKKGDVDQ